MSVKISDDLLSFFRDFVGDRLDDLIYCYSKPLPEAFRVNTLKVRKEVCLELLKDEGLDVVPVPFTVDGFYAKPEGVLSVSLWHMLGYVYVQGPVSMLITDLLEIEPGCRVLDLCAAPGSKATHIAQKQAGKGVLVANDVSRTRLKALASNMQRCGVVNGIITLADGRRFGYRHREFFDRVLVDAPCSSLGIGMKDWTVLKYWNPKTSIRLARLQTNLLFSGYSALKKGGILVYSTCTFHPYENEMVVSSLVEKHGDAEVVQLGLQNIEFDNGLEEWNQLRFSSEMKKTARIFPYQSGAEGFYVAKIRKRG
ncbi:MAG: RsmB/NOP family class I SAM-dependent RNA methyltransferase [Candidatus Caldarchaeum sp.]|nr:RsmB/NOP family class I SAM-dependent RNA methyltransferase [Candidatus Caldarchaeum sp.]MCS7133606.1 RsmB/NOP family class I SAM-dependent RNA methyltransferase [Candidatus Caldarchaeum sp.]MDW8435344.1 RsmB/NOP family class I SAM-dependent RNA methyltransferase [Candidatus Caldarchaeum sp.]